MDGPTEHELVNTQRETEQDGRYKAVRIVCRWRGTDRAAKSWERKTARGPTWGDEADLT